MISSVIRKDRRISGTGGFPHGSFRNWTDSEVEHVYVYVLLFVMRENVNGSTGSHSGARMTRALFSVMKGVRFHEQKNRREPGSNVVFIKFGRSLNKQKDLKEGIVL